MSRKPLPEGKHVPKEPSLNSLLAQLEDPRSLMSFLTPDMQEMLLAIPSEYLDLDEQTLLAMLKRYHKWEPNETHEALRDNFWAEYDRVQFSRVENMMVLTNVYNGVMTRAGFYKVMRDQCAAAYIATRSMAYEVTMKAMQNNANRRLSDFLKIPIKDAEGNYTDVKLLELVLKTAVVIDLRNKGAYLQRSETKNLTLINQKTSHTNYNNIFQAASGVQGDRSAVEVEEEINAKIRELEMEAKSMLPPPSPMNRDKVPFPHSEPIDAEFSEVDKDG